jgi:hypothetical protein
MPMRVSQIQILQRPDSVELRARVESERDYEEDDWFESFTLWYRFPEWCTPYLSPDNGDPFLAALLLPAMRTGEPLIIDAPVSPALVEALPEIQAIFAVFDPRTRPVHVDAISRASPLIDGCGERRNGLFFSMGVDSFYSLLKNQRDHPNDSRAITHLLSVHGFDAAHDGWDPEFPAELLQHFNAVAAESDKTLVPVVTNIRQVGARLAPWTMLHGAGMASIALALEGAFQRATIAASSTYDLLAPWGTHPVLDPLWSTEAVAFVHDGCELDTIDKTRFVARYPLVMKHLRVCPGYRSGYNCGRCMKCLRTMTDLLQAGLLKQCETLPHEIDPEALRAALRIPAGPVHIRNFRRRQETFARTGQRPDLNAVLIEHLNHVDSGLAT